jgi:hypothetical protein
MNRRQLLQACFILGLLGVTLYSGMVLQANADQKMVYDWTIAHDQGHPTPISLNSSGSTFTVGIHVETISFGVIIFRPHDTFANQTKTHGVPDCLELCNGVHYWQDPTVLITNEGRDVEQCGIWQVGGTIACQAGSATDIPDILWFSTSTNTPAATDTNAGATGPCYSGLGGVITSGGLKDADGTVTAGAQGATVTTTISLTFTAAETDTAVQASCIKTETDAGAHIFIYAEGTFGPDTLNSGDTITPTWKIARS